MKLLRDMMPFEEWERRVAAARRRAGWELGDPSWAGVIIRALECPAEDAEALKKEMAE